jgi:dTMP kinase
MIVELMEGFIVCIDGIDAAGKNTQSVLLHDRLKSMGFGVSLRSYPDYTSRYGKIIREYLDKKIMLSVSELFLMFLSDMIKDRDKIVEEIKAGDVVIMDRYFVDTIAFQTAGGFGYEVGKRIEEFIGITQPAIIVYLDIPASVALERKLKQGVKPDRHEENIAYLEEVRKVFDRLYEEKYTAGTWVKIDGTRSITDIHREILSVVVNRAKKAVGSIPAA